MWTNIRRGPGTSSTEAIFPIFLIDGRLYYHTPGNIGFTPLALNCLKGQHPPAILLVISENFNFVEQLARINHSRAPHTATDLEANVWRHIPEIVTSHERVLALEDVSTTLRKNGQALRRSQSVSQDEYDVFMRELKSMKLSNRRSTRRFQRMIVRPRHGD